MLQILMVAVAGFLLLKGLSAVRREQLAVSWDLKLTGKSARIGGIVLVYTAVALATYALLGFVLFWLSRHPVVSSAGVVIGLPAGFLTSERLLRNGVSERFRMILAPGLGFLWLLLFSTLTCLCLWF